MEPTVASHVNVAHYLYKHRSDGDVDGVWSHVASQFQEITMSHVIAFFHVTSNRYTH